MVGHVLCTYITKCGLALIMIFTFSTERVCAELSNVFAGTFFIIHPTNCIFSSGENPHLAATAASAAPVALVIVAGVVVVLKVLLVQSAKNGMA